MGDGDVVFNDAEIQRILNSPAMAAEVRNACTVILARARAIAPVRTGTYVNSFSIELKRHKRLRVVGYVHNNDPKSMAVEARWGVLTRARRARG